MANLSNFSLVLMSNGQTDLYPDNKPEAFRNKQAHEIQLKGPYEVALSDISYLHQWNNVKYPINVGVYKAAPRRDKKPRTAPNVTSVAPSSIEVAVSPPNKVQEYFRAKGKSSLRVDLVLSKDASGDRLYESYPDAPELGYVQLFSPQTQPPDYYHKYDIVHVEGGL